MIKATYKIMGKIYLGDSELTPQQEVNTISGNVETVSGNVNTLSSTTTAHTSDTSAHVTASDKTNWNGKLDATAYTPTDLTNYYTKSETSGKTEISTALNGKSDTGHTHSQYLTSITSSQITTALGFTPADNAGLTAHTANTTVHVTQAMLDRITALESRVNRLDPYNGYEYVDLGLPSGTLWAKYNVGATSEIECGNCYMYGKGASQYNSSDSMYTGMEEPLATSADTAAQVMSGSWHMPTRVQCDELTANTTYTWETDFNGSGVNGGKFTATNGKYVFFPACGRNGNPGSYASGYYWTSSPDEDNAYQFAVYPANIGPSISGYGYRLYGCSIRGVVG